MSSFVSSGQKQRKKTQDTMSSSSVLQPVRDFATPEAVQSPEGIASVDWQSELTHAEQFGHSISRMAIHREDVMQQVSASTGQVTSQGIGEAEIGEQRRENRTGLPDALKAGVERLSGFSLGDIRVHYNSPKPTEVDALAYTQGTEIHVGPGQEQHLAHEAWHVVQQKQGRVKPTRQAKGAAINDDEGLEREADVMGARAAAAHASHDQTGQLEGGPMEAQPAIQRVLRTTNGKPLSEFKYYEKLYRKHKAAIDSLENQERTIKNQEEFEQLIFEEEKQLGVPAEENMKEEETDEEENGNGKMEEESKEDVPLTQPLPELLKEILKNLDVSEDVERLNTVLKEKAGVLWKNKVTPTVYKAALFEKEPFTYGNDVSRDEQASLLYLALQEKAAVANCYSAATRLLDLVGLRQNGQRVESFTGGGEKASFALKTQQQWIAKLCEDLGAAANDEAPIIFKIQLGGKDKGGHGFTLTVQNNTVYQLEALAGQGNNASLMLNDVMKGGRKLKLENVQQALVLMVSKDPAERIKGALTMVWDAEGIALIENKSTIQDPMNIYWTASPLTSEGEIRERVAQSIQATQTSILQIVSAKRQKRS